MSKTASREELLEVCIQDLHAGRTCAAERLSCVADQAGPALSPLVEALTGALKAEASAFEALGIDLDGEPNLWMGGIMDDSERDTRSIEEGRLLDIAIIGAVRKAVAADAVSLETAIALAESLAKVPLAETLRAMRERCDETDGSLRGLLQRIA